MTTPNLIVDAELQIKVAEAVQHSLNLIRHSLPNEVFPRVLVTYKRAYSTAGWALFETFQINLDPILLNANQEYMLNVIVPHEVAHLASWHIFGEDIDHHGKEWKSLMVSMGLEPNRCHNLDTSISKRKITQYEFACNCQNGKRIHSFSSVMRKKILIDNDRMCGACNGDFRPINQAIPEGMPKKIACGTKMDKARWVMKTYKTLSRQALFEKLITLAGLNKQSALTYFHKISVE